MLKEDKGYHKLLIWQRARELVKLIYLHSESFPKSEEFGLKSQVRRAGVSIVLNIVEGYRRSTTKDFLHFLSIANGSLAELEAAFAIAIGLGFITHNQYSEIETKRREVGFLLHKFIKSLKNK